MLGCRQSPSPSSLKALSNLVSSLALSEEGFAAGIQHLLAERWLPLAKVMQGAASPLSLFTPRRRYCYATATLLLRYCYAVLRR